MSGASYIDITNLPELQKAVEKVRRTKHPVLLKHGQKAVARLSPLVPSPKQKVRKSTHRSILNLINIANGVTPKDNATDISINTDKYYAQAIYEESHSPKKK